MATAQIKLPPGFQLDSTTVPAGFVLDSAPAKVSKDIPTGMRGALEATAAMGSGIVAGPVSGMAGIAGAMMPGPQGQGAAWAEKTGNAMTYHPKTDMGRRILETASYPFEKLAQVGDTVGGSVTDFASRSRTSPEVAGGMGTAANVAIQAAPMLLARGAKAPAADMLNAAKLKSTLPVGAEEATAAGYSLTPTQLGSGVVPRMLEGLSGSAKMEKLASVKNQKVTNDLIKEELGIQADKQISVDSLESIRKNQGASYEAVKSAAKLIKPDQKFKADLNALRGDFANAANAYPDLMRNDQIENLISSLNTTASPRSMVELTRKLRSDAAANLKAYDDPAKQALGMAQRNASSAIEELIDRALTSVGKNDLVSQWKEARRTIAKTYDVEAALNETTGDVSARYLGKLMDKGRPLTGGLKTSAEAARAFEGSLRDVGKMRDTTEFGYGDLLLGGAGSIGAGLSSGGVGSVLGAGAVLARPVARHLLLSKGPQVAEVGLIPRLAESVTSNPYAYLAAPSLGLRAKTNDNYSALMGKRR